MLTGERWRHDGDLRLAATRVGAVTVWIGAFTLTTWATINYVTGGGVGMDSHAYWLAARVTHPYRIAPGAMDAFLYSPLFAQLTRPLALLPWPMFEAAWGIALSAVAWWLTAPMPWRWRGPALAICWAEILTGNINLFLAAALVLAVHDRPPFAAASALTKILPAAVVGTWWVAGRKWHELTVGIGSTILLAGLSFAAEPGLWHEWIAFLLAHRGDQSATPLRLAAAIAVAAGSAWSRAPRWLALALWLSLPMATSFQIQPAVVLLAVARLPASAGCLSVGKRNRRSRHCAASKHVGCST